MGDVWRARDRVLGRSVAVKMMRPDVIAEPVFAERFTKKPSSWPGCRTTTSPLFDYGTYEGIAYLVMEFVEGQSLSAELREAGVLPVERVRAVVAQMALALAAAHEAGVVHRDVKPANVLIGPDGIVKLTDFGIARATDAAGLTRTGETLGTPSTSARSGRSVDRRRRRVTSTRPRRGGPRVADRPPALRPRHPDRDGTRAHVTDPPPTLPAALPDDLIRITGRCSLRSRRIGRPLRRRSPTPLGIAFAEVPLMRPVSRRSSVPISVSGGPPVDLMVRAQGAHSRPEGLHAGGALGWRRSATRCGPSRPMRRTPAPRGRSAGGAFSSFGPAE